MIKNEKLHIAACKRKENGYIDPETGFFVLTAYYLKNRGHCCGAGCRHCPYPPDVQRKAGRPTISNESDESDESKGNTNG